MTRFPTPYLPWLPLVLLGCSGTSAPTPGAPNGFPLAHAWSSCAPWDGPATAILLSSVPPDSLTDSSATATIVVYVWKPVSEITGETFDLIGEKNVGAASSCEAGECEAATAATIRLREAQPDSALEGTVDLVFPGRGRVSGGFRAAWQSRRELCG